MRPPRNAVDSNPRTALVLPPLVSERGVDSTHRKDTDKGAASPQTCAYRSKERSLEITAVDDKVPAIRLNQKFAFLQIGKYDVNRQPFGSTFTERV